MLRAGTGIAVACAGLFLGIAGCSDDAVSVARHQLAYHSETVAEHPPAAAAEPLARHATPPAAAEGGLPGAPAATGGASLARKIIYDARIELVVENFDGVTDRVIALVGKFDGYVADSNLSGSTGNSRYGRWKIRVPVEKFDAFVSGAQGLGELVGAGTTSQDVSEEYYDVEARIRNKTKEEERLIKLLEDRPGKLEDVIAIERELSRVREEIERMQGRLRVLADLTSLTTVTLSIKEIRDYVPPEAPTLATRIGRSFGGSLESLRTFGENLLIGGAALVPWLPLLAVGAAVAYWGIRRLVRWGLDFPRRALLRP